MVCRVGCTHKSKVNKYSAFKIRNIFRRCKTRIALYDTKAIGFIQTVLVRYVDVVVFICVNQNKFDMKKKKKTKIVTVDMYHKYAEIDEMYSSKVREVNLDIPSNLDRKSTRLNSSHVKISYAVYCLKKK